MRPYTQCSAYQHPAGWSEGRRRHLSQKASVQASSFRKLRFARCSLANRQFEKVARHALKREMSPAERSCNRNVRKVGEVTSVRASSDLPTHLGSVMTTMLSILMPGRGPLNVSHCILFTLHANYGCRKLCFMEIHRLKNCLLSENHGDGRVCDSEIGDIGFRSPKNTRSDNGRLFPLDTDC